MLSRRRFRAAAVSGHACYHPWSLVTSANPPTGSGTLVQLREAKVKQNSRPPFLRPNLSSKRDLRANGRSLANKERRFANLMTRWRGRTPTALAVCPGAKLHRARRSSVRPASRAPLSLEPIRRSEDWLDDPLGPAVVRDQRADENGAEQRKAAARHAPERNHTILRANLQSRIAAARAPSLCAASCALSRCQSCSFRSWLTRRTQTG